MSFDENQTAELKTVCYEFDENVDWFTERAFFEIGQIAESFNCTSRMIVRLEIIYPSKIGINESLRSSIEVPINVDCGGLDESTAETLFTVLDSYLNEQPHVYFDQWYSMSHARVIIVPIMNVLADNNSCVFLYIWSPEGDNIEFCQSLLDKVESIWMLYGGDSVVIN